VRSLRLTHYVLRAWLSRQIDVLSFILIGVQPLMVPAFEIDARKYKKSGMIEVDGFRYSQGDMMHLIAELDPGQLRPICNPSRFEFASTADLPELTGIVGQKRAVRALEFGMGMKNDGFNIYVSGVPGTGKFTAARQFIDAEARTRPAADDWVYVFNFKDRSRPNAIRLPAGWGRKLRDDLDGLINELKRAIPAAFENENYRQERDRIIKELKALQEETWQKLNEYVEQYSFGIVRIPGGFMLVPTVKGKPLSDEDMEKLSEEQKQKLRKLREMLSEQVEKTMLLMREQEREAQKKLAALDDRVARFTIQHPVAELKEKYQHIPEVPQHLDAMMDDLVSNANLFKQSEEAQTGPQALMQTAASDSVMARYSVNLLVDNGDAQGAPVIYESNPNFANLVGRIEHRVVMGALVTDFTMIRAGALHRANGGYLVLEALSLFQRPQAWDALKRALKEGEIRVEEYAQSLGLVSTAVLEPETIPLQLKVVIAGPAWLYYLLTEYDEDFLELFKVQADFDDRMPRNDETIAEYAQFIASFCRKDGLRHFAPDAVARVVDHSSRLVSDQQYLSASFRSISDLLTEASYWAGKMGRELVTAIDVQRAIDEQHYRGNRTEERLREAFARDILLIDVSGARPGQINGLAVLELGQISFGAPSRITARTYMGRGGVVDIQREVKMGGPIHSKGVMILSAFLGHRYAQQQPLSLRATLVFEQTYSMVEGDSASLAELCALISSIGDIPLRQDMAVTGSVNQHGDVQAIGGVNEKIEGFFDTCRLAGELTGTQGVIIPRANVQHLALRQDVVDAVAAGRFHIHPVVTVDQALTLLTGLEPGEADESGAYPPESVNGRVLAALQAMAERWKELASEDEDGDGDAHKD